MHITWQRTLVRVIEFGRYALGLKQVHFAGCQPGLSQNIGGI